MGYNEQNIDIWRDPWVGDEQGSFIESEEIDGLSVVGDLIDYKKMEWRIDLIEQDFIKRDMKYILAIPLSSHEGIDEFMWAYSKNGSYTVKIAYMLGNGVYLGDFCGAWLEPATLCGECVQTHCMYVQLSMLNILLMQRHILIVLTKMRHRTMRLWSV